MFFQPRTLKFPGLYYKTNLNRTVTIKFYAKRMKKAKAGNSNYTAHINDDYIGKVSASEIMRDE